MDRQKDEQINRQIDRQIDRQTSQRSNEDWSKTSHKKETKTNKKAYFITDFVLLSQLNPACNFYIWLSFFMERVFNEGLKSVCSLDILACYLYN